MNGEKSAGYLILQIQVNDRADGMQTLRNLINIIGKKLPATTARSRKGNTGYMYFRQSKQQKIAAGEEISLGSGVTIFGSDNCEVIGRWDDGKSPEQTKIAAFPKAWSDYLISLEPGDPVKPENNGLLEDLKTFSVKDLLSIEFPDIFYPVEGLIPVGETVIASAPKTGKSWMMLHMGMNVARGEDFLHFHTNKCEVIYFALEDSEQFMQDRIRKVIENNPEMKDIPDGLHIVVGYGIKKLNQGFLDQLDAYLAMYPGTRLVIVDTLKFIRYGQAKNVSPYDHDYEIGNTLKKYADAKNIALVIVTHTTKSRYSEDDLMNVSGTLGVTGAADAIVVISKEKRSNSQAMLFVDGRRIQQSYHQIIFNRSRFIWEYQCELSDDQASDEGQKLQKEYMESPVRHAAVKLAADSWPNGWKGSAGKLIEEAAQYGIGVGLPKKDVGAFLSKSIGMFMQYDRIYVEVIKHGTAPNMYRISEWQPAEEEKISYE